MAKRKKSYNPFKMWGSWIGAFIGLLGGYLTEGGKVCEYLGDTLVCRWSYDWFLIIELEGVGEISKYVQLFVIPIMAGFLIGWGIHSIFRALKGRKRR